MYDDWPSDYINRTFTSNIEILFENIAKQIEGMAGKKSLYILLNFIPNEHKRLIEVTFIYST